MTGMRLVTCRLRDSAPDRGGAIGQSGMIHGLPPGETLQDLLGDGSERLQGAGERALREPSEVVARDDVRLRAPLPRPATVRDFYAFEQHVRTARQRRGLDMDPDWYELP